MKRAALFLLPVLALAAFAGCNTVSSVTTPGGNNSNTTVPQALQAVIAADETNDPVASGAYGGSTGQDELGAAEASSVTPSYAASLVLPDSTRLNWWRKINSFDYTLGKGGDSDSVSVSVSRTLSGVLNGKLVHRHGKPDTLLFSKPFGVTWSRSAIYRKLPVSDGRDEDDSKWMVTALSLAHAVQTAPTGVTLPAIQSVTVSGHDSSGAAVSVTFTDPTRLYAPGSLPNFPVGDSVQVKVVTDGDGTGQLAFIHFDFENSGKCQTWRRPLAYNVADGGFVGSFKVREGYGGRHPHGIRARSAVWVDVLSKATLFDTTAPYAGDAWGVPYRLFRHKGAGFAFND